MNTIIPVVAIVFFVTFVLCVYLFVGYMAAETITDFGRRYNPRRHSLIMLLWPIWVPCYMVAFVFKGLMGYD